MENNICCVVWMTGYSGSGKTTLANTLKQLLSAENISSSIIDGDEIRNKDREKLSFSDSDRIKNSERVIDLVNSQNTKVVIVSIISPFRKIRENARKSCKANIFLETFVNSSLQTCESRDTKGLYKMAREGKINNFTGISSEFHIPSNPEIIIDTENYSMEESCLDLFNKVYLYIKNDNLIRNITIVE